MKIVLADGCFDPLHYGHLLHLIDAKRMGDELWVSVTPDEHVNKGPHRPVFKEAYRAHMLAWLRCVDRAAVYTSTLDALRLVKPAIFVKGKEYEGKIEKVHLDFCKDNGIEIKFTDTPKFSSTSLLRYYESRRG